MIGLVALGGHVKPPSAASESSVRSRFVAFACARDRRARCREHPVDGTHAVWTVRRSKNHRPRTCSDKAEVRCSELCDEGMDRRLRSAQRSAVIGTEEW